MIVDQGGFAVLLRRHRIRLQLTQEELAERAGVSSRSIGEMERGRSPRTRTVELLAVALELAGDERDEFLGAGRALSWAGRAAARGRDPGMPGQGWAAPAQLPADTTDFTGREEEIAAAVGALSEKAGTAPRIAVVAGAPGIGKTVFAVHVAHRVLSRFSGCQLFANLRGADPTPAGPAEVLAGFLRALGVDSGAIPEDLDERAALYRSLLTRREALVVLDNAANEDQVRPLLPGSADCAALVTSRRRLTGLGAQAVIGLRVFSEEESVELLGRVAGTGRVSDDAESAREVARLCGGLPLALRIAGARLAARPHRGLHELARGLADEHRRLDLLSYSDLTVRASFDLGHQALSEQERRLLRRLAALDVPDFPLWLAAAVGETDHAEAEELMERLAESNWVQPLNRDRVGQMRYGMHDLVRAYGRERMAESEPGTDGVRAAARYVIGLANAAREADRGQEYQLRLAREVAADVDPEILAFPARHGVGWLEAESATMNGLVTQTFALGLFDECWAVALAGCWLGAVQNALGEYTDLLGTARQAARRSGDRRVEALVVTLLGESSMICGDHREADAQYAWAERVFLELDEEHGLVELWKARAVMDRARGDFDSAMRRSLWSREAARRVGDDHAESIALRGIAQIHLAERRFDEALPYLMESLAVASRSAKPWQRLPVLLWLGEAYRLMGRLDDARTAFLTVVDSVANVRDDGGEAYARLGLGQAATDAGDYEEADAQLGLAAELAAAFRIQNVLLRTRLAIAEVRMRTGQPAEAVRIVEEALPEIDDMGAAPLRAQAEDLLSRAGR
ncbi:NB-ARC domain-containing protein [Nonomuraea sp. NPDC049486]|uniref:ATP-binding protein n=1 Tax=Nonomuraea sp. NPDC049486 TaxID=3155773 RepID=UPI00343FF507